MRIGVPKEIKTHEYRIGMTPGGVREAVQHGHAVQVETGAGMGIGLDNEAYEKAGATIAASADEVFAQADLIVKVKEPQPVECARLQSGQTLFTYLHLAPDPEQAKGLLASGCIAIAYETVTDAKSRLPLLAPMSEVAGRMAIQAGAHCLEKSQGGSGTLLGGVPGVLPGRVTILGGGVVGTNAARIAMGMGVRVTVLDRSLARLRELDDLFQGRLLTRYATLEAIEEEVLSADLTVGAVLIPGAAAPKLIPRALLSAMKPGSVLVDVSIDQGGCFETSRPTTHAAPTYVIDGIVHYCVANMPGAVARTSTFALNNATLPHILQLADRGVVSALQTDPYLCAGLNIHRGRVTYLAVADALGYDYCPPEDALALA
ncbi:MAG: alanine dehydrogenase [Synechococcaceae cyanobacterium SM1_2_3]|nr:alanine dehydrogenase [Synechococcaceae cyanobacterium SM1_2_3]